YCIPYTANGATVKSGMIDKESKSLIVKIDAASDGDLTLSIPRSVLDSTSGTEDDRFFVLVNGEETSDVSEEKTDTARSVTIQFESGAEEIEIIGTQIVPEFGAIAALVLAVAIISIIAVSAKTRLRLMPKY
ncbi:MAG: PEFG-CTERM sorting domain-containing protein, partial [Thaumarchaeota archaeon]|nr:PEFG-CTERM sorting domain-containing protein [Nitrososphaerota archaeon]